MFMFLSASSSLCVNNDLFDFLCNDFVLEFRFLLFLELSLVSSSLASIFLGIATGSWLLSNGYGVLILTGPGF